jgi:hypothetical protein
VVAVVAGNPQLKNYCLYRVWQQTRACFITGSRFNLLVGR